MNAEAVATEFVANARRFAAANAARFGCDAEDLESGMCYMFARRGILHSGLQQTVRYYGWAVRSKLAAKRRMLPLPLPADCQAKASEPDETSVSFSEERVDALRRGLEPHHFDLLSALYGIGRAPHSKGEIAAAWGVSERAVTKRVSAALAAAKRVLKGGDNECRAGAGKAG